MAEKKVTEKDVERDREQVQALVDAEEDRGYVGREVDPTPVENYTLQTPQDAPTPETDPKAREAAQQRQAEITGDIS